jgi:hypothetical protein
MDGWGEPGERPESKRASGSAWILIVCIELSSWFDQVCLPATPYH